MPSSRVTNDSVPRLASHNRTSHPFGFGTGYYGIRYRKSGCPWNNTYWSAVWRNFANIIIDSDHAWDGLTRSAP